MDNNEDQPNKKEKINMNLVVIGHVDSGKSTSTGHLIYKCGGISERELQKLENEAKLIGQESFKYAWVLSKLKTERERGMTIDISLFKFDSHKYTYTIIDAQGHKDFIKNMITGASQADIALIVVSSATGEFETSFGDGGQAREHALLAYTMGIKQVIVGVNKMDKADYSQERYEDIKTEVLAYLKKTGFKESGIQFIPYSGFVGDNLIERSTNLSWHKGSTLLEALDKVTPPTRPIDKPLRVSIQKVCKIPGVGVVPTGKVESGVLKVGMKVQFAPLGIIGECKSIESHHVKYEEAGPGMNIGFNVRGVSNKDIKSGMVCGDANNDPPMIAKSFTAQVIILNVANKIKSGYTPIIDCGTNHIPCKFEELITSIDRRTGKEVSNSPAELTNGDSAIVKLTPLKDVIVEKYTDIPQLGRFAMRDSNVTIGVGIIKSVEKKTPEGKKKK